MPTLEREPLGYTQEWVLKGWPRGESRTKEECGARHIGLNTLKALERKGFLTRTTFMDTTVWRRVYKDRGPIQAPEVAVGPATGPEVVQSIGAACARPSATARPAGGRAAD